MLLGTDSCRWVEPRLPLLAGGELLGLDRRRIERHVLGCAGCRERLEALRRATSALRDAGRHDPTDPESPSLWPALARQIRESRHARSRWDHPSLARFAVGLAAGLLLAAGALGVWVVSQRYRVDVRVTVTPKKVHEPTHHIKLVSTPPAVVEDDEPDAPEPPDDPRVVAHDRDRSADLGDRPAAVPTQ